MRVSATLFGLLIALLVSPAAEAQMFGRRQTGRPLSRQAPPGLDENLEDVGTLTGNERFLRRNRLPTAFVGPDIRELDRFVGLMQATINNQITSAVEEIRRRVDRSETINEPLPPVPPQGEMYVPQLELDVSFPEVQLNAGAVATDAMQTLVRSTQLSGSSRIAVSMAGRTAILRGEVPSARDRDLAAVLLSFEPGISSIRNELTVNPQLQPASGSLQAMRDQRRPTNRAWVTLSQGTTEATRRQTWEPVTAGQEPDRP